MSKKLRAILVWLVLFLQVWTPAQAQTLPIAVDKSAAGQRPIVGVSNGVPVVNIAPPSAGGVSDNRFLHFNVGPSGAVLNNSGRASQTQLAGPIAGNPMLGHQRARTILNQVTAPNPSRLLGVLEVAGQRANVIVANPAGITCDGCGFLNAERAMLTTGKPAVGPNGLGFEVAGGLLRIEGAGLHGANLSQVDLMARALEINAGIWADRLNVTAGAAWVEDSGAVTARAGAQPVSAVALDTAALGGMYANSIRLIGTETGVGVNLGGDLVALTGNLEVNAAGDVRITPSATLQAARDLRLTAGGDLALAGQAQAQGEVTLRVAHDARLDGAVSAGGVLAVAAAGDVSVGGAGRLRTQDALRVAAGQDLALSGTLLMGGQDVAAQAGRDLRAGAVSAAPDPLPPSEEDSVAADAPGSTQDAGAGDGGPAESADAAPAPDAPLAAGAGSAGLVSAQGAVTLQAGRDLLLPGRVAAAGALHVQAGGDLTTSAHAQWQAGQAMDLRAGADAALAGSALSDGTLDIRAARGVRLDGSALAQGGALWLDSAGDLRLGALSRTQGHGIEIRAERDLITAGTLVSTDAARLRAGRDAALAGSLNATQALTLDARGNLRVTGTALSGGGTLRAISGGDLTVASRGALQAVGDLRARSGGRLLVQGNLSSQRDIALSADSAAMLHGKAVAQGRLNMAAGADLVIGPDGLAQGGGALWLSAGQDLRIAGVVDKIEDTRAAGALRATAGRDLSVTGTARARAPVGVTARRRLDIEGSLTALAGDLSAAAGGLHVAASGRLQASGKLDLKAEGGLDAEGALVADEAVTVQAGHDAKLNGLVAALGEHGAGELTVAAGRDLLIQPAAQVQAGGRATARAGRGLDVAGTIASVRDMRLTAARAMRLDGTAASGEQLTLRGQTLEVGVNGLAQAKNQLTARADAAMRIAGRALAGQAQSLTAGDTLTLDGTAVALRGALSLEAERGGLVLAQGSIQQAGGDLSAAAGRQLNADGSAAASRNLTLQAGTCARVGGIASTQAGTLRVTAADDLITAADSRLQAAQDLRLQAGGELSSAGTAFAGNNAHLYAGATLTHTGSTLAGGDLSASASDALIHRGRFVAGADAQGNLTQPGSLTLTASAITHPGISLAGQDLRLSGADLNAAGGTLSAIGTLTLAASSDLDTSQAAIHGQTLALSSATLHNAGGKLTAADDARLTVGGVLDNAGGLIAAAGPMRVEAAQLDNRDGTLAGADLTAALSGTLDNRNGLIQAGQTLTLSAARLDNRATLSAFEAPVKGVRGTTLDLTAEQADNQGGSIGAGADLTLKSGELDNRAGDIAAQGAARIEADTLRNAQGKIVAERSLTVLAHALQSLGTLQSGEDLAFEYAGALNQSGDLNAGRDLSLTVGGAMENTARLHAGRDLSIRAGSLTNRETGELAAGGDNTIEVAQGLENDGLIDGQRTRITAQRVDNRGRIYGGQVAIGAQTLVNTTGPKGAAVIASRGDLDLGVDSLINERHALIYTAADLRIGQTLEASRRAAGQAGLVRNAAATIEAAGAATISAAQMLNQNPSYASQTEQVSSEPKFYYRSVDQAQQEFGPLMDGNEFFWVCHEYRGQCTQDASYGVGKQNWLLLLPPSDKYPASRYGPPFDYGQKNWYGDWGRDPSATTWPIAPTYIPEKHVCSSSGGDAGNSWCDDRKEVFRYAYNERIWDVFGVTPPAGVMPEWHELKPPGCWRKRTPACDAYDARRTAYEQAYEAFKAQHLELDARIRAFNSDVNHRWQHAFTYYRVTETVTETRTLSSDPGKILSGGAMTLSGSVTNDKSQIAAGGALSVNGPAIDNIGASGTRAVRREGTMTLSFEKARHARKSKRWESTSPYSITLDAEPIELPVGIAAGDTPVTLPDAPPAPTDVAPPREPGRISSIALPGGKAARAVAYPARIPDNRLFSVDRGADAPYLVTTDPRFTGERTYVSSGYLLDLLRPPDPQSGARLGGWDALIPAGAQFLTPAGQPRRLGDGFHEQQIVADQILAATGQRFLENYSDYDAQYKALLAAGARFAQAQGITLGVKLTEAQQRQLDTDLVWLQEQTVTLPDGSTQTVLVPQVYLLVRPEDLKGDGTLMAGRAVHMEADGGVTNSGTLSARQATVIRAQNLLNRDGGTIQGDSIDLAAREDLTNLVSRIQGGKAALQAGRDVALTSTSASEQYSNTWGTHQSGVSRVQADSLDIQAGRDLTLTAAQVSAKDEARLQAGRDVTLATLTERYGERIERDPRNRYELSTRQEIGSTLAAGGGLTVMAGQDVKARAADVTAGKQLTVDAGRDLQVAAGVQAQSSYLESYTKQRGFWSSRTSHQIYSIKTERAQASTLTGGTAVLRAGRDVNVTGSNVGARHDLLMSGGRAVNLAAGENSVDAYQYQKEKQSGFGALGGLSFGTRKQTDSQESRQVFHTASLLGSVEGDTRIQAGGRLNMIGSDVIAPQGDVMLGGKQARIDAAMDTVKGREFHEIEQSGLTLTASNPVMDAIQTGRHMAKAADNTDNSVMQGLAAGTAGLAAYNAYDAVQTARGMADPNAIQQAGGVSIKLSVGGSKSRSLTERSADNAFGATLAAGKNLILAAQGAGRDSGIWITGSNLSAGDNAVLQAEGGILLEAAKNTFEQKTDSKSSSASIGIGYSMGGSQNGFTLELGASIGRGQENGRGQTWTHSRLTAGKTLALRSGGDMTVKGVSGNAEQILASAGRDLRVESLQDSSAYDARHQSAGFGLSLCIPPYCVGASSASANIGQGRIKSSFRSVTEQTRLQAGDGGFQIEAQRNTSLAGGIIGSSGKAVADGLNRLDTGTLTTERIENHADYSGYQVSVGGGIGFGGKGADLGAAQSKQIAGGATKQAGASVSAMGKVGMAMPVVAAARGSGSSTTQSALSGGTLIIRDAAAQQDLTGMTVTQTVALLNRDTAGTLNTLKPIFDKEKIEAGFEIASEASRQMGQFLTNRAKEIESAKSRSEDPKLSYVERIQATKEYADLESHWGSQGSYSQWGAIILGAASGNVMGGTGQFIQAATVKYLQTLGAAKLKELSQQLGGEGSTGHAALHAVLGCAGAAAQGSSCGAGGAGALSGVVLSKLLESVEEDKTEGLSEQEKQARVNVISSIVVGIVGSVDPDAAAAVQSAARIELENNSFYMNRDKVARLKAELTEALLTTCGHDNSCLQAGFDRADRMASAYDVTLTLRHYPHLAKEKAKMLAQSVLDLAPGVSNASALYELVTGKTATGDEANKYFAAIGLVPVVGGIVKKGGQALHAFAKAGKAIDVARVGGKSETVINISPGKFDYLFGRVSSNAHNVARSNQLAFEMRRLGVPDTAEGRRMLLEHLELSVKTEGNVARRFSNQYGNFEVRESLFMGPSGKAAKFESTFQVLDDGSRRLSTLIPFH